MGVAGEEACWKPPSYDLVFVYHDGSSLFSLILYVKLSWVALSMRNWELLLGNRACDLFFHGGGPADRLEPIGVNTSSVDVERGLLSGLSLGTCLRMGPHQ